MLLLSLNPHPIYNFLSCHCLSPTYYPFVSIISTITIPKTVQEVLSHSGWQQALIDEIQTVESNHTWVLVPPPMKSTARAENFSEVQKIHFVDK